MTFRKHYKQRDVVPSAQDYGPLGNARFYTFFHIYHNDMNVFGRDTFGDVASVNVPEIYINH